MNIINFILFIAFSSFSLIVCRIVAPSQYSKLLGTIEKETVNQVLLTLPKRSSINILQMCNSMSKAKETYALDDAESAYLVFKWISQNIKVDFTNKNKNEKTVTVYDSGEAGPEGISALFNLFCSYFKVESKTISGLVKTIDNTTDFENTIKSINSTWNYIVINNESYLVDASLGRKYFSYIEVEKEFSDFYFATKPGIFIKSHYPNNIQYQFLSQPYTLEKFEAFPYVPFEFFMLGFMSFSPETKEINGSGETKITLIYTGSVSTKYLSYYYAFNSKFDIDYSIEAKITNLNGKIEFVFDKNNKETLYLLLVSMAPNGYEIIPIIIYKLNPSN